MGKVSTEDMEALKAQIEADKAELEKLRDEVSKEMQELKETRKEVAESTAKLHAEMTAFEEEKEKLAPVAGGTAAKKEPEEKVEIELYKDKNLKSDVLVCVNGKTYQIQRGKKVLVPKSVKEVLDNTKKMDELAIQRQEEAAKNFA